MSERLHSLLERAHNHTVFHALGIVVDKIDADETVVSLTIDERHLQHIGLVHGGVYMLLAESAASIAAAASINDKSSHVVALQINANHISSCKAGRLYAQSKCLHKGRRTLVYEAMIRDDKNNLISIAQCTLMVVEALRTIDLLPAQL